MQWILDRNYSLEILNKEMQCTTPRFNTISTIHRWTPWRDFVWKKRNRSMISESSRKPLFEFLYRCHDNLWMNPDWTRSLSSPCENDFEETQASQDRPPRESTWTNTPITHKRRHGTRSEWDYPLRPSCLPLPLRPRCSPWYPRLFLQFPGKRKFSCTFRLPWAGIRL